MKHMRLFIATLLILVGITATSHATSPKVFVYEGTMRYYDIYVPTTYDEAEPLPMVVMLHGRGGTGESLARDIEMNQFAEVHGFIALYPDGIYREWNYTRGLPWVVENPTDDALFLKALVAQISTEYVIDSERVYVGGFSNGGFMAQRLACEASDTFAAFATVGATGFSGMSSLCDNQPPVPILLIHGTADPIIPWDGQTMPVNDEQEIYVSAPALETFGFWASHNDCSPDFEQSTLPAVDETREITVRLFDDAGCEERGAVRFYAVVNGGHTWPGVEWTRSRVPLGDVTLDFHASEALWEFFSAYTLSD